MIDDCIIEIFKKCDIYTKINIIKTSKNSMKKSIYIDIKEFENILNSKCYYLLHDPINFNIFPKYLNYIKKFMELFNKYKYNIKGINIFNDGKMIKIHNINGSIKPYYNFIEYNTQYDTFIRY